MLVAQPRLMKVPIKIDCHIENVQGGAFFFLVFRILGSELRIDIYRIVFFSEYICYSIVKSFNSGELC